MRILVIDGSKDTLEHLVKSLSVNGYQVDIALCIKDGDYHINVRSYDLILGGLLLSDGNIKDVINIVRNRYPKVPIITLGDNNPEHEIESFYAGADDYLAHPINPDVLLARIRARLKMWDSNIVEIEDLIIIPDEERITFRGKDIDVKGKPFEVLAHLARRKDQIVSKEQLLNAIWDEPELVTPNVIEVAINQIRQKMDKVLNIHTIETVRRRGYRFCYPKGVSRAKLARTNIPKNVE